MVDYEYIVLIFFKKCIVPFLERIICTFDILQ